MSGDKPSTPAYDELQELLKEHKYEYEQIAVVDGDLWCRLANETKNPFGTHIDHPVIWYRHWTMVVPSDTVLVCTKEAP